MQSKYLLFILIFFISCQSDPVSEVSEPEIDLSDFILQDNFQLELIASEPLIEAPVAMTFDNQGRVWVMEMPDYMPNIHGSEEDVARGRIVILEDGNGYPNTLPEFAGSALCYRFGNIRNIILAHDVGRNRKMQNISYDAQHRMLHLHGTKQWTILNHG